eukprot:TRINITY_DN63402_c0_g1_i1.p1 TRINITY_DN63402_c0_g1~~TRINITY_DN63402_c0_g1_i1.p1  ORF type:complete len:395 (-),score=81.31 TRINITY_DN63402_c0_g1_i1:19-1203(-)
MASTALAPASTAFDLASLRTGLGLGGFGTANCPAAEVSGNSVSIGAAECGGGVSSSLPDKDSGGDDVASGLLGLRLALSRGGGSSFRPAQPENSPALQAVTAELNAASGLLEHCDELAELLVLWRESRAEMRGAMRQLGQLVRRASTSPRSLIGGGGCVGSRNDSGGRSVDFARNSYGGGGYGGLCGFNGSTSSRGGRSARGHPSEDGLAGATNLSAEGGEDSPASGSSSASFDLEVDEELTRRLRAELDEEDYDDLIFRGPCGFTRLGCGGLEPISEDSNEDALSSPNVSRDCIDSHPTGGSEGSSRASSVERLWAGVREVGGECPPASAEHASVVAARGEKTGVDAVASETCVRAGASANGVVARRSANGGVGGTAVAQNEAAEEEESDDEW